MSISMYRSQVNRLQGEIAKLEQKQADERKHAAKAADEAARIEGSITKRTSPTTVTSKLRQAQSKRTKAADHEKKAGKIGEDIVRKTRNLTSAQSSLTRALDSQRRKDEAAEKKRRQEEQRHLKDLQRQQQRLAQQTSASRQAELAHERALTREAAERHRLHAESLSNAQLQQLPEQVTILLASAGPRDETRLDIAEEARDIAQRLRSSEHRDAVTLEHVPALRTLDLIPALNEHRPTVLHFAGHGSRGAELIFQDDDGDAKPVSAEAITATVATVADHVQLVVLNACHSSDQAAALTAHVPAAIGMAAPIGDDATRIFATALYGAIADGFSIQRAFDQALAQLQLEGIPQEHVPQLFTADDLVADELVLVRPPDHGELRILPSDDVRERVRDVGRRVVAEHGEALQILADHDPDAEPPAR